MRRACVLLFLIAMAATGAQAADQTYMDNTDVAGNDYRHFDLPVPRPRLCQQACYAESRCQAWTFYREGLLKPLAICWLKDGKPTATPDKCCISGLKPGAH